VRLNCNYDTKQEKKTDIGKIPPDILKIVKVAKMHNLSIR